MNSTQIHPQLWPTTDTLALADRWDHVKARFGVNRLGHLVEPGLYALGHPTAESPVFVTANYTLSFDALRSSLQGIDGYILVLDTQGVNVWCAAGKGTFGTDELVQRIKATDLESIVSHRTLILPQLGAVGVSAHRAKQLSGFRVKYGPVLASDLPAYLAKGQATSEMRRVRFTLRDRLTLVPIEVVWTLRYMFLGVVLAYIFGGLLPSAAVIASLLAGAALFPVLLPWIPTRQFSTKGFILGTLVALPFAVLAFQGNPDAAWWVRAGGSLAYLLLMPPPTAYIALNFTGASTYTSKTGVRREMNTFMPIITWMIRVGFVLAILVVLGQLFPGGF